MGDGRVELMNRLPGVVASAVDIIFDSLKVRVLLFNEHCNFLEHCLQVDDITSNLFHFVVARSHVFHHSFRVFKLAHGVQSLCKERLGIIVLD